MKITDKWGYPIEGYINNPIRSFIRFIFQIIRGNIRISLKDK
jgi:hypothetical protein